MQSTAKSRSQFQQPLPVLPANSNESGRNYNARNVMRKPLSNSLASSESVREPRESPHLHTHGIILLSRYAMCRCGGHAADRPHRVALTRAEITAKLFSVESVYIVGLAPQFPLDGRETSRKCVLRTGILGLPGCRFKGRSEIPVSNGSRYLRYLRLLFKAAASSLFLSSGHPTSSAARRKACCRRIIFFSVR